MKDQLEESLSDEEKKLFVFAVNGEQKVEHTEFSSLLDGEHTDMGKNFT